jgi:beta-galactosidase/beta-glucuronidase
MADAPRPEHPRPSVQRDASHWRCLNGTWGFQIDPGDSGRERGLQDAELDGQITVPFCPESEASGVHHVDFMPAVWYRRVVEVPADWEGRRTLLHFQAVDYEATVFIDGQELARHVGGSTPFTVDLTDHVEPGGSAVVSVRARDDHRRPQPQGKQSSSFGNHGCRYFRTTGIWQTVWLESVPRRAYLGRPVVEPDVAAGRLVVTLPVISPGGRSVGLRVQAELADAKGPVIAEQADLGTDRTPRLVLQLPPERRRLWSLDDPFLYKLTLHLVDEDGKVLDDVESYAGLRGVSIDGLKVLINGEPVFQRTVLDQGYWPDTLMTAPSDEDLVRDIELSMQCGFNGARLHQKVFEERFLYHADRLGYLCWGEFGDWGYDPRTNQAEVVHQWLEAVQRDRSHPCLVGWCPMNETHSEMKDRRSEAQWGHDELMQSLALATRLADPTRLVLDASGYSHRVADTDVYDVHDYEQDPEKLRQNHEDFEHAPHFNDEPHRRQSVPYAGQPYWISEFGGIWWNAAKAAESAGSDRSESWGYGKRPRTEDEWLERFAGQCRVLLEDPRMFGYCYTQLTDVFQEENGLLHMDRSPKFDLAKLREVQQAPAAIERR